MHHLLNSGVDLLGAITAKPDPNGLPGASVAQKVVNGIFFFVLLGSLAAMLVSAGTWAIASRSGNHQHTQSGKVGVLIAAAAALIAGAAPAIINFFFSAGQGV